MEVVSSESDYADPRTISKTHYSVGKRISIALNI